MCTPLRRVITCFGTATSCVSRYSESVITCSLRTISANDRTERFPLRLILDTADRRSDDNYIFLRCICVNDPLTRL